MESKQEPSPAPAPEEEKWGTKFMGPPAPPAAHPHNQQAATWTGAVRHDDHPDPYLVERAPVERLSSNPVENILGMFNTWTGKAETLASNVWLNFKTAPSKSEAAWGKLSLTTKALTEGGFESLYKQTFPTDSNEKMKKTFACYLSTSTGPVAGTLYLSNVNVAFCSDRPLSLTTPSGQEAWSYYKVVIPMAKIANVNPTTGKEKPPEKYANVNPETVKENPSEKYANGNPVTVKKNPSEKYIQIVTVDGHDFWFMGFVNYDKACTHLLETLSDFATSHDSHRSAEPVAMENGPRSVSEPVAMENEPRSVSEPVAMENEPRSVSEPVAMENEPRSVSEPVAMENEPRSVSEPVAMENGPHSVSEPVAMENEPRSVSEPVAMENEPRSVSEPVAMENKPRSVSAEPVTV